MCLDLFSEETTYGSILVNDHSVFAFLCGGLQEVWLYDVIRSKYVSFMF